MRHLTTRLWVGLLAYGAAAAMITWGSAVPAAAAAGAAAKTSQHAMQGRYCRDFVNHLSRELNVSNDRVAAASARAARQTVDDAVRNGDLTRSQGDSLKQRFEGQSVCPAAPAATPTTSPTTSPSSSGQSG